MSQEHIEIHKVGNAQIKIDRLSGDLEIEVTYETMGKSQTVGMGVKVANTAPVPYLIGLTEARLDAAIASAVQAKEAFKEAADRYLKNYR